MSEVTPRVVFDCNVFVQGIANRNSPARTALRLFFDGSVSLFVSEAILGEVRDVLGVRNFVASSRLLTTELSKVCSSRSKRKLYS